MAVVLNRPPHHCHRPANFRLGGLLVQLQPCLFSLLLFSVSLSGGDTVTQPTIISKTRQGLLRLSEFLTGRRNPVLTEVVVLLPLTTFQRMSPDFMQTVTLGSVGSMT